MAYTIIATGVSGSGKTTILQHVLRLILGRDTNSELQNSAPQTSECSSGADSQMQNVVEVLERDLVIVEAMGNAATQNNTDSSRCGKLIKVEDIGTSNVRSTIQCLILEGSRLRHLCPDPNKKDDPERSFHIFYYLLAHGHKALNSIQDAFKGKYDQVTAAQGYERVNTAMHQRKPPSIVAQTWDVLAAILLLLFSRRSNDVWVAKAKELLGIPTAFELVPSNTSPADTRSKLLQISINLYRRVFSFWTKNKDKKSQETGLVINLLDICGSEVLGINRLAQLIINQWNDKIQQEASCLPYETITLHCLNDEPGQSRLRSPPDGFDNLMDLLRGEIDEQRLTKWLSEKRQREKKRFKPDTDDAEDPRLCITGAGSYTMMVNHLSGSSVLYNHGDIPAENRDTKIPEVIQACSRVRELLVDERTPESKAVATIVSRANRDWEKVKEALAKSKVLFIKCIKASATLRPWDFDTDTVAHQVDSLAIGRTHDFIKSLGMKHSDSSTNFICKYILATGRGSQAARTRNDRHSQIEAFFRDIGPVDGPKWTQQFIRQGDYIHWSEELHGHLQRLVAVAEHARLAYEKPHINKRFIEPVKTIAESAPVNAFKLREAIRWYTARLQVDHLEWILEFEQNLEPFESVFKTEMDIAVVLDADEAMNAAIGSTIDHSTGPRTGKGSLVGRRIAERSATLLGAILLAHHSILDRSPDLQAAVERFSDGVTRVLQK
ncbi:P-loop containing nucleoside triphosphate hydrolase protein [Filobasidium floriforme]|uniref:P-loop containing nucleoside triphosphate hydrolase protein n=1 Tax=Filobasidium floriforme TaxID=5210 RepID=UPI001E8DABE3|nr:P-loop containing nucleoside triphosphate hydrolase protein [Filobasidium floriforme]KAH8077703.1 P-loop containing nucleoside triphosphate hydrolase protein [Filobasidium floriforme]